jgi:hypothetical protein
VLQDNQQREHFLHDDDFNAKTVREFVKILFMITVERIYVHHENALKKDQAVRKIKKKILILKIATTSIKI